MSKVKEKPLNDVGVIVGRFHVGSLHDGQRSLFDFVIGRHSKVIVLLGLAPVRGTIENPLDFESRKQMVLEDYPDVIVLYQKDVNDDDIWSKQVDEKIGDLVAPNQTVTCYGSRDSFIAHYKGKYECVEMEQKVFISGTEIRKKISNKVKSSEQWREGAIWQTTNRYPTAFPTVDVAIINSERTKLLLGRKPNEREYRFIGGFVKPGDNLETTVRRETEEETHLEVDGIKYIISEFVDDWRYRNSQDKIITTLFEATIVFGRPEPDDDIEELRFFDIVVKDGNLKVDISKDMVVPIHRVLMAKFEEHLNK